MSEEPAQDWKCNASEIDAAGNFFDGRAMPCGVRGWVSVGYASPGDVGQRHVKFAPSPEIWRLPLCVDVQISRDRITSGVIKFFCYF
jgi:hypothetical protein